jgi:hypothetical protein
MNYRVYANTFLLWGWIMSLASFSHFIIIKALISREAYEHIFFASLGNWFVFVICAFIIEYFMSRKLDRDKKVFSHLDRFINILWKVSGSSIPVAVFLCIKLEIPPPPIFLLIMGTATTVTGLLIKFKPVTFGGVAFFIFSIISTFVQNENTLLVSGIAVICCYLIPGYILKSAKE